MNGYYFKLSTALLLVLAVFCAAYAFFTRFTVEIRDGHTTYLESRFWGAYDIILNELPADEFMDVTLLYGSVDQFFPKTQSMFYIQIIGSRSLVDLHSVGTKDKNKAQNLANRIRSAIENRTNFSESRYYALPLLYLAGFFVLLAAVNQIDAFKIDEKWPP